MLISPGDNTVLSFVCCRDDLQDYDPFDDGGFCRCVLGLRNWVLCWEVEGVEACMGRGTCMFVTGKHFTLSPPGVLPMCSRTKSACTTQCADTASSIASRLFCIMQTVRSTAAHGLCLKARLLLLLRLLVYPSCHTAAVVGRSRFWLFLSYMVSFASVVGAVWVLMQHYGEQ